MGWLAVSSRIPGAVDLVVGSVQSNVSPLIFWFLTFGLSAVGAGGRLEGLELVLVVHSQ